VVADDFVGVRDAVQQQLVWFFVCLGFEQALEGVLAAEEVSV